MAAMLLPRQPRQRGPTPCARNKRRNYLGSSAAVPDGEPCRSNQPDSKDRDVDSHVGIFSELSVKELKKVSRLVTPGFLEGGQGTDGAKANPAEKFMIIVEGQASVPR